MNKLVPCAWLSSGALEVWRLRLRIGKEFDIRTCLKVYRCMYVCMSTCYSAPSRFLLRGAPDYSADTESEFHAEAHEQLRVKDLPRVPTRRLEVDSNPQPSGCKAPNIPLHHRAPRMMHTTLITRLT